jgi:hypothetical protein
MEIESMAAQQKKVRAERDEALARLERLRDSEKLQSEKSARESLDLAGERDRAVVRLEKGREEFEKQQKEWEKTQEYLIKERDKALALLNEARHAQKEVGQGVDQVAALLQNLASAEKADASSSPENKSRLGALLAEAKAKLQDTRKKAGESRHKYEVSSEIAADPSFVQVRAKDMNLDRLVEMKIVAPATDAREEVLKQLVAEAQMIGHLEHPNIQPMYELSIDETGRAFYTAKLLSGSTLAKILEDLQARKSSAVVGYDLRRLLTIFDGVCDALAFAHEQGVAHSQLTAETVNVGAFGEIIVTGWERARVIKQDQVQSRDKDLQPDLAGVGDLLYYILTLTPPVPGDPKAGKPDKSWLVPKGLWQLASNLRAKRDSLSLPRVKQIQSEVREFRYELGPRGGRANAFEKVQHMFR